MIIEQFKKRLADKIYNGQVRHRYKYYCKCKCDKCGNEYTCGKQAVSKQLKKYKKNYCKKCICTFFVDVPQRHSEYWTNELRTKQSITLKNSDKHKENIKHFSVLFSGKGNPMYGKKASAETRRKMSISRTGKIGENATAWKGGDFSLVRTIKRHIHKVIHWYYKIYKRDNFKCILCGSNKKIEAHHINPISVIIKTLIDKFDLKNKTIQEQYDILIKQPEIIDENLTNGITLCRCCHQKIHNNWGSHYSSAKTLEEIKKIYEENKKSGI